MCVCVCGVCVCVCVCVCVLEREREREKSVVSHYLPIRIGYAQPYESVCMMKRKPTSIDSLQDKSLKKQKRQIALTTFNK